MLREVSDEGGRPESQNEKVEVCKERSGNEVWTDTGGWVAEEEMEKKKREAERGRRLKGMKAAKQGDELKQDTLHSRALSLFPFFLSVLHIFPQLNKGWRTHNYQSLFDPDDGCEEGSAREECVQLRD